MVDAAISNKIQSLQIVNYIFYFIFMIILIISFFSLDYFLLMDFQFRHICDKNFALLHN